MHDASRPRFRALILISIGIAACVDSGHNGSVAIGSSDVADAGGKADAAGAAPLGGGGADAPKPGGIATITAAVGGEVVFEEGLVTLRVAAGALVADTKITIKRVAGAPWGVPRWAFAIGPEGTRFDPPAELEIDLRGLKPPAPWLAAEFERHAPGERPAWPNAPEAIHDGDRLSLRLERGGTYSMSWVAVGMPDDCSVTPKSFAACGGELDGDWKLEGLCYDDHWAISFELPVEAGEDTSSCDTTPSGKLPAGTPTQTLVAGVDEWPLTATLSVADGRFVRSAAKSVIPLITSFAPTCASLAATTCDELGMSLLQNPARCTGTTRCECKFVPPSKLPAIDAAIELTDDTLQLDDGPATQYCVDGDRLRVLESTSDGLQVTTYHR